MSSLKHLNAPITKADGDAGTFTAVASAPTLDRDGEVIDAFAFDPLPASVPVHDGHFGQIVGRAFPHYDSRGVLVVNGKFSTIDEAQRVRTLVREGVLDAMSVVFHDPVRRTVDGVPHITKGELLAADFVSIPSNRDALVSSVRSVRKPRPGPVLRSVNAQIALVEAELFLLDLDEADRRKSAKETRVYQTLREAQELLDDLRRTA